MITDTYKWCTSRKYNIPAPSGIVSFPVLNLKTGSTVNVANKLTVAQDFLQIYGSFEPTYGKGYSTPDYTPTAGFMCVALGTGATPPAATDREMESYVADFDYVTQGWGAINQTDAIGTYDECIVTYRYTGASEVTISEVGIYMYVRAYNVSPLDITALMEHSLLATPKVMNTNDTITLSVKIYHTGAIALS